MRMTRAGAFSEERVTMSEARFEKIFSGKRAALFDLDGTLVDSMGLWQEIDVEFLGSRGLAVPDRLQDAIQGMSFTETAVYFKETFHLLEDIEEIKAIWDDMAREAYLTRIALKPFTKPFLSLLASRGIRTAVCTSNARELTEKTLEALGVRDWIDDIVTTDEVAAGKPAPDVYLRAAADLAVKPAECVVFEDIPAGISAGKNAGMTVCAVEDAFSARFEAEKRRLADEWVATYEEFLQDDRTAAGRTDERL